MSEDTNGPVERQAWAEHMRAVLAEANRQQAAVARLLHAHDPYRDPYRRIGWFGLVVDEGYEFPKYYGLAYYRPESCHAVAYPVPLNLLVAVVRWAWLWVRFRATRLLAQHEPPTRGPR